MTVDQRAAIGAELATMAHGGDRKSEEIKGSNDPLISLDQDAEAVGVGRASVVRAKKRMKEDPQAHAAAIGAELANMTVGRPKDEIVQNCTLSLSVRLGIA